MARPLWQVGLIKKAFPTPFTARLTRIPLVGRLVQYLLFEGDEIVYLPIDETINQESSLAVPSEVLKHFVKQAGFRWIMNECICRAVSSCRDYPVDLGCLFLGESAQQINPALGRPATVDEALEHIDRCREAGLVHLIGRNKLDSVWLKAKPANRLLTICNCCPCCCLWKILMLNAYQPVAESVQRLEGVEVMVAGDCQGCGTCVENCFVNAISLVNDRAVISDGCRGCGRCVLSCPEQAIELKHPDMDSLNNDLINRISSLVDVGR